MVDNIGASCSSNDENCIREQDRLLPIANVGRIMKQILPANAKISKEAKESMQECVSEFIAFVTGEASDKCRRERRKTVNGDDVCWALGNLGFDDYAVALRRYLQRFRDLEGEHRVNSSQDSKATSSSTQEDRNLPPPSGEAVQVRSVPEKTIDSALIIGHSQQHQGQSIFSQISGLQNQGSSSSGGQLQFNVIKTSNIPSSRHF
ncbi:hypothetical protein Ancab_030562 [Ancistrocladus abbreviatus]